jgi:hypothetical protein
VACYTFYERVLYASISKFINYSVTGAVEGFLLRWLSDLSCTC